MSKHLISLFKNEVIIVGTDPLTPADDIQLSSMTSSTFFTAEMKIFCASGSLPLNSWQSILQITTGTKSGYQIVSVWRNQNDEQLWFGNPLRPNIFAEPLGITSCDNNTYNSYEIVVRPNGDDAVAELFRDGDLISNQTSPRVFYNYS